MHASNKKFEIPRHQKKNQPSLSMLTLLLTTIVIGGAMAAALYIYDRLRQCPLMNGTATEQQKHIDELTLRMKLSAKKAQETWAARLAYLNSTTSLTEREKEEREIALAKEEHRREDAAMNRGGLPYYNVTAVYSAEVSRKDDEMCHTMDAPSNLGLNLPSKNPNTLRWKAEAEARARAYVGSVFEWMTSDLMGQPTQEMSYCMIRINGQKRWMYLTVTREKTESLKDVLNNYIKTLDRELLFGVEPIYFIDKKPATRDEMWNPVTRTWE